MRTWTGDPYWNAETFLFSGSFPYYRNESRQVRGMVHLSTEAFTPDPLIHPTLLPRSILTGQRIYVMISPYVVERRLMARLARYSEANLADEGKEPSSASNAQLPQIVPMSPCGDIQGWYYPADNTFFLWEGQLEPSLRSALLPEDTAMQALWRGILRWVQEQFPEARQVLTLAFHQIESKESYQAFLSLLGYQPLAQAIWSTPIRSD